METQMQVQLRQFLLSPLSKVEERDKPLVAETDASSFARGQRRADDARRKYQDGLHLLMWVSSFVLLIGCANLANLMLVRATSRKQQTSVRSALGAPRARLVRQALTESVVLAVLGGIAGIVLAFVGTRGDSISCLPKGVCAHSCDTLSFGACVRIWCLGVDWSSLRCCSRPG